MSSATVTSKGQITLPSDVREEFGLKAGDKVEFYKDAKGSLCVRIMNLGPKAFLDSLPRLSTLQFIDDENAVGEALLEDDERIRREYDRAQRDAA